jgi:hypothetical protein
MKRFQSGLAIAAAVSLSLAAQADQVIVDDLISQGSACIGQDCVNGEAFGADTLRLKENNLRIHFQDTSSSAAFPSADWRIVINDRNNGGRSYFALETEVGAQPFLVEAGAPAHSVRVAGSGKVGIGVDNPAMKLHLRDYDTPTLRFEQDGSRGWQPHSWDLGANETNFFIRDLSNNSQLPLVIKAGAPTDALVVDADGTVKAAKGLEVDGVDIVAKLGELETALSGMAATGATAEPRFLPASMTLPASPAASSGDPEVEELRALVRSLSAQVKTLQAAVNDLEGRVEMAPVWVADVAAAR